jgi:hypothetical protein
MLFFTLWPARGGFLSYEDGLAFLRAHPAVCDELRQLVALGLDTARHVPASLGEGLQHVPLAGHARYRREEIRPFAAEGGVVTRRGPMLPGM